MGMEGSNWSKKCVVTQEREQILDNSQTLLQRQLGEEDTIERKDSNLSIIEQQRMF